MIPLDNCQMTSFENVNILIKVKFFFFFWKKLLFERKMFVKEKIKKKFLKQIFLPLAPKSVGA